jgi:hypothetical protein
MRRRLVMFLLAAGTLGGYASGFAHMHACRNAHRAAFEEHIANVCVNAAKGAKE